MSKRSLFALILTAVTVCLSLSPSMNAQVSDDPNFTPSVLTTGLSSPFGLAFNGLGNNLVLSQTNQVSLVKLSNGTPSAFVSQTAAAEVAVRSSDGVVAVNTLVTGPIDFYSANGSSLGSLAISNFPSAEGVGCLSGVAFDSSGNFYVAAAQIFENTCVPNTWGIYEFPGPNPWSVSTGTLLSDFNQGDVIEGLVSNPAPISSTLSIPSGSFYAVSTSNGHVDEVCASCDTGSFVGGTGLPNTPSSVAVDPLLGDAYITDGTQIFRIPPPPLPNSGQLTPVAAEFAHGFSNATGITFDNSGNLYVNDAGTGKLWVFTRNAFATPPQAITPHQVNSLTFVNSNEPDQTQSALIPASADFCDINNSSNCAAFWQAVFVPVLGTWLDSKIAAGSSGDRDFFGGGPVPAASTCVLVPSASPIPLTPMNCLITLQVCYTQSMVRQSICTVHIPPPSTDLIELTSSFNEPLGVTTASPDGAHFAIDYDTPPNNNTLTDITIQVLDCCTGKGGTKSGCSQTFFFSPGPPLTPDFSLSATPNALTIDVGGSAISTIAVNAINAGGSFTSPVNLALVDAPSSLTSSLSATTVSPGGTSTLNVSAGPFVMASTFTLVVSGNVPPSLVSHDTSVTVTVAPTTSGLGNVISNLLTNGCIDNAGIANALASKLAAAQSAISAGQLQTAINILTAFKNQVQAQAGKHIATSCTIGSVTFDPVTVLLSDAQSIINSLRTGLGADPITGYVLNSSGVGVSGATVTIFGSQGSTIATTNTDITGFYYFATTGSWTDSGYSIQVTGIPAGFSTASPAQTFTWRVSGLTFNFGVN